MTDNDFELDPEVMSRLETMFSEVNSSTPPEIEAMFDTSLSVVGLSLSKTPLLNTT